MPGDRIADSVTNPHETKKYYVDFQRFKEIRKNIFQSPPPLLTGQQPQFLSQSPLPQQLTAKRFFGSGFPYIWRDIFLQRCQEPQIKTGKMNRTNRLALNFNSRNADIRVGRSVFSPQRL